MFIERPALLVLFMVASTQALQCWHCHDKKSNAECLRDGHIDTCAHDKMSCHNHVDLIDGKLSMTKECGEPTECHSHKQFEGMLGVLFMHCDYKKGNSYCRCCCFNDECNDGPLWCRRDPSKEHKEKDAHHQWTYTGDYGVDSWPDHHDHCGGTSQSPINIVTKETVFNPLLGNFNRSVFDVAPDGMTLKNNGHSLVMNLDNAYTITDRKVLPGDFKALQFHFHWADDFSIGGSEHTVNGEQYYAELHIVHMNQKYDTLEQALDEPDGLAVLGFFIVVGDTPNKEFEHMFEHIRDGHVVYADDEFEYEKAFPLSHLMPQNLDAFYRYSGSLTTPPCSEAVIWTVFEDVVSISKEQAELLKSSLYMHHKGTPNNHPISANFRPTLPLNGRIVEKSVQHKH